MVNVLILLAVMLIVSGVVAYFWNAYLQRHSSWRGAVWDPTSTELVVNSANVVRLTNALIDKAEEHGPPLH